MGRHTKMAAAEPPEREPSKKDPLDTAHDAASLNDHGARAARHQPMIHDHERYDRLSKFRIKQPNEWLAGEAIKQAARVWACTEKKSDKRDADAVKFLANYLYEEAIYWGTIDPRRALPKAAVDSWLATATHAPTSARTYKSVLHTAGRVLYPGEYPPICSYSKPRAKPTEPASQELVKELYAVCANLPAVHKLRTQLILDLTTQAGLQSCEILDLRGSDVTAHTLETGETVAILRVHRKGTVHRLVPVVCPIRSQRLLARAQEVGRAYFLPTPSGKRPYTSTVSNAFQYLRERGFPSTTVEALRVRWMIDMVNSSLPTAVVARLCGNSLFRSLAYHSKHLSVVDPEQLAELLLRARRLP